MEGGGRNSHYPINRGFIDREPRLTVIDSFSWADYISQENFSSQHFLTTLTSNNNNTIPPPTPFFRSDEFFDVNHINNQYYQNNLINSNNSNYVVISDNDDESMDGGDETTEKSTCSPEYWVKGQWTYQEDRKLIKLVNQYGNRKWSVVAEHMVGRIGKQCRERWHNHLRPDIKKSLVWTDEEEMLIIKAHERFGNRWSAIANYVPGRTENAIKNHWNSIKRKQISTRKISKPEKLKGVITSTILEDYIKNKYFNNESYSSSTTNINTNPNNAITNHNYNDDYHHGIYDDIYYLIHDTIDEEISFMRTLFPKNDNNLKNQTVGLAGHDLVEISSKLRKLLIDDDYGDISMEEADIYFSSYMFDGSDHGNIIGSNMEY
ncbi:hypothetical protein ABFX02_03G036100 [Erythranthe guttata]